MEQAPRYMLATVGLSPLPVVLAAATVAPDVLVLLHTSTSVTEAESVRHVLGELLGAGLEVQLADIGSGQDFCATHAGVVAAVATHVPDGRQFVLGYNGGTAAMVACAVHVHHHAHGGRPELRCYVDDVAGKVHTDDGESRDVAGMLTVAQSARLHGYRLEGRRAVRHERVDMELARHAWSVRDRIPPGDDPARVLAQALHDAGDWINVGDGRRPDPWWIPRKDMNKRRGVVTELCHLAALMGGDDVDEIAHGVVACRLPDVAESSAEFDLLVRRGRRVVALEVKSSLRHALPTTGARLIMARSVFGSTTRTAMVAPGKDAPATRQQLLRWNSRLDVDDRLSWLPSNPAALTNFGRSVLKLMPKPHRAGRVLRATDHPRVGFPAARPPGDHRACASGPTVAAAGGSALAVHAAVALVGEPLLLLTAPQARTAYADLLNGGTVTGVNLPDLSSRLVLDRCRGFSDATLVVTPGTKTATAGMTIAAADGAADLVHLDLAAGLAHSWTQGPRQHRPEVDWAAVCGSDFTDAPAADWFDLLPKDRDGVDVHDAESLRAIACWGAEVGLAVWFNAGPSVPWWVPVLLTGRDRAVGVVAPTRGHGEDRKVSLAAATHLSSLLGDAARVLMILPASERPAARLAMWTCPYRGLPSPLIGHQRPGREPEIDYGVLLDALGAGLAPPRSLLS